MLDILIQAMVENAFGNAAAAVDFEKIMTTAEQDFTDKFTEMELDCDDFDKGFGLEMSARNYASASENAGFARGVKAGIKFALEFLRTA